MFDFLKIKSEWLYWVVSLALCAFLAWVVFSNLRFIARTLNEAFNPDLIKTPPAVHFNLEKIKELGVEQGLDF